MIWCLMFRFLVNEICYRYGSIFLNDTAVSNCCGLCGSALPSLKYKLFAAFIEGNHIFGHVFYQNCMGPVKHKCW